MILLMRLYCIEQDGLKQMFLFRIQSIGEACMEWREEIIRQKKVGVYTTPKQIISQLMIVPYMKEKDSKSNDEQAVTSRCPASGDMIYGWSFVVDDGGNCERRMWPRKNN